MHDTLSSLVERALTNNQRPLEFYLREYSRLPGARPNLELAADLGRLLADAIPQCPDRVYALIKYLTSTDRRDVIPNTPAEFVMVSGIFAYGMCAAVYPVWREETFTVLRHFARSPFRRIREAVAVAYQQMLGADWQETICHLLKLVRDGNFWQQCVAVTALAEPRLLYNVELIEGVLELQQIALERIHETPQDERKKESFRTLRRALGFTLSIVTAEVPEKGFALMCECAAWNDNDVAWILRENLKKKRLARFKQDAAMVSRLLA